MLTELEQEMLQTLERAECQFWACEGPDKPFKDMKTCFVCDMIRKIRKKERKNE